MRKDIVIQRWVEYCEDGSKTAANTRKFFHSFVYNKFIYELMIMGGKVRVVQNGYQDYEIIFFPSLTKAEIFKLRNPESEGMIKYKLSESEYEKLKNYHNGETYKNK
jgi:hypothetical protein